MLIESDRKISNVIINEFNYILISEVVELPIDDYNAIENLL